MSGDWINEQRRRLADNQSQLEVLRAKAEPKRSWPAAENEVTSQGSLGGTAKVLSWFALISTVLFILFMIAASVDLNARVLALPLAATAAAQLIVLYGKNNPSANPNTPQPQSGSPPGSADRENAVN